MIRLLIEFAAILFISYVMWQELGFYAGFAVLAILICLFVLELVIARNRASILSLFKGLQNGKFRESEKDKRD